jgi:lipoprotein-releasing system ATP-binding protein
VSDDAVVQARRLVRDLGTDVKTRAVDGVDLVIRRGEFVALTGPSGSGKSKLLYLLGTLDRPTSGEVFLEGVDVTALDDDHRADFRRERLGFVFQFHFLLPEFSALENVMLPMLRRGHLPRHEIQKRATATLASMGLGDLGHRRPHQLSGGQQQRVSIARAVANGPRLLLADEPTGNLDSTAAEAVIAIFESLARNHGITIVMVTHEAAFAKRAGREICLRDGRIEQAS